MTGELPVTALRPGRLAPLAGGRHSLSGCDGAGGRRRGLGGVQRNPHSEYRHPRVRSGSAAHRLELPRHRPDRRCKQDGPDLMRRAAGHEDIPEPEESAAPDQGTPTLQSLVPQPYRRGRAPKRAVRSRSAQEAGSLASEPGATPAT